MLLGKVHIRSFVIICYLIISVAVHAQDSAVVSTIRSLEKEYLNADKSRKADIELDLSEYYWQVQPEKGIEYGKRAIESYRKLNSEKVTNAYVNTAIGFYYIGKMDSCIKYTEEMLQKYGESISNRKKGVSNNILCVAYRRKGSYQKALKRGEEAIKYFELYGDSAQIAGTLDNMASIYIKWGKYEEALEYSIKSLSVFESVHDTTQMAITLFNIGSLYSLIKDNDQALKYLYKSEHYATSISYLDLMASIYNELGVIYQGTKQWEKADSFLRKSLALYKDLSRNDGIALVEQNIGSMMIDEARCKDGKEYLLKSLSFFKSVNSIEDIMEVYIDLGRAYACMTMYDSAAYYLNKAVAKADEIHNVNLKIKALENLQHIYFLSRDFQKAFLTQNSFYKIKDSLRSADMEVKLTELTRKYNLEKAENETKIWKNQQQIEASKNRVLLILSISLILFILLASFFVWQRRKKEKEIIRLRAEKEEILKKEMQEKMYFQSKQLTTHALNMLQKNELLQSLQMNIDRIREKAKDEVKPELRTLNNQIRNHLKGEKDWDLFKMYFEQINTGFFEKLREINPDLTSNDLRLIALIKLNMNIKEVASVLNLSPNSVKNARYRLRKKLKLDAQDDLFDFVNSIG